MAELLLARGTVAELHREAFAGQEHRGGEPSGSFCWRGAAAKVLNGRGHCGRNLSGRSCWPGAARFVAGQGAMAELLLAGAPRSAERKEGRCVGDPRVGDPALGTVGRYRIAEAARRGPYAWELVLGNLRWGTLRVGTRAG